MTNDTTKPIYYRAWIKPIDEWADELLMEFTSYGFPTRITAFMQDKHLIFEQDDLIIEQYIGLKDKNDKGIFEGDVLDIHQTINGVYIFTVERDGLGWTVRYGQNMVTPRLYEYDIKSFFEPCRYSGEVDYEVIGNIHENPELLETTE